MTAQQPNHFLVYETEPWSGCCSQTYGAQQTVYQATACVPTRNSEAMFTAGRLNSTEQKHCEQRRKLGILGLADWHGPYIGSGPCLKESHQQVEPASQQKLNSC